MISNTWSGFDFGLGADVDALRDGVNRFAQERIAPRADEIDRSNTFPRRPLARDGQCLPARHHGRGGVGRGRARLSGALRRQREEVSRASASIGPSYGAHSNLCVNQIRRNGNDDQRGRYLPGLVSGEHVGALAMSETGAGSDVISMRTRADRKGDRYVLNGTKMWITNGPVADTLVIYAKTDPTAGSRGITAFIVERGFKGFSTAQKLDKLGMRGPGHERDRAGGLREAGRERTRRGRQRRQRADVGSRLRAGVVLGGGAARHHGGLHGRGGALCAHERSQFGQAIGRFQLVQAKLADMYVTMNAAKAYVYAVARACDRGETTREDAAGAILYAAERATWMALEAIQCLGGNGYINDFPTGRLLRDAKLYEIGAGTSEIRRMLIGREIFDKTR